MRGRPFFVVEKKSFVLRPRTLLFVRREFQRVEARMSEGEDKASSAVKEVEVKMKGENYYVRLATNLVTTAKETRLVEDDTQDTFLKGELQQQKTECSWCCHHHHHHQLTGFHFCQGLLGWFLPSFSLARAAI